MIGVMCLLDLLQKVGGGGYTFGSILVGKYKCRKSG